MSEPGLDRPHLNLTRRFAAAQEQVFDAFIEPEVVKAWWGPHGFMTTAAAIDPRPGGTCRWAMTGPDGHVSHLAARIIEINRPGRLVLEMTEHCDGDPDWERIPARLVSLVTLEFHTIGPGETEVRLRHDGLPDAAACRLHEIGWGGGLDRLAAYFTARPG